MQSPLKVLVPLSALVLGLIALAPMEALGFAIINNGTVMLGVNDEGHFNTPNGSGPPSLGGTTSVGLRFVPTGAEATAPGCLCEGWGAASVGLNVAGGAAVDLAPGGAFGISSVTFNSTATTATSVVTINGGGVGPDVLQVTHAYQPSVSPNLYEAAVTIKNIGTAAAGDIRYRRVMDWDVEPTPFSEFVTIGGLPAANVLLTHNDGFDGVNPLVASSGGISIGCAPANANFTKCGPADHGAFFEFGFGDLAVGEEANFKIFYGAAADEAGALAALGLVGAEVFSMGFCDPSGSPLCTAAGDPNTFIFAFAGVGGTPVAPEPVPEPGTLILMGTGLGLAAVRTVRRRNWFGKK